MKNLADPSTQLNEFFKEIGKASAEVAPVARVQADLFANMADTFAAIGHSPTNLQQAIEKAPPTLDTAIASFKVQQPFLADFADLSRRLRPAVSALPGTLPTLDAALKSGTQVLPQTVDLNERTQKLFASLDDLAKNPNTLLSLEDLTTTVAVTAPMLQFVAPYQTVCNYTDYFLAGLGGHMSEDVKGGTIERVLVRNDIPLMQPGKEGDSVNWRPADIPANVNPKTAKDAAGYYLEAFHGQPYAPAIDAQGNADCQTGQTGYPHRAAARHRHAGGRPLPARELPELRPELAALPDRQLLPEPGRRQPHRGGAEHARPRRPHLHRRAEPEGRAMRRILRRARTRTRATPACRPSRPGVIAIVVIGLVSFEAFTRTNPFSHPYTFSAVFQNVNNLQPKSPVRIAGVNVGKVDSVQGLPGGRGAARVTMEVSKSGLPLHKDATLKIRPRVFLEGNEFVDLQPGSPDQPVLKKGATIPINQTSVSVQFGQVLTTLQADTRKNLQGFLKEYSQGLADGGAQGFAQAVKAWPPAYRYGSLANEAALGTQPHDLSTVEQGQAKVFRALDVHESNLKSLITNFNTTAAAFAREDGRSSRRSRRSTPCCGSARRRSRS